MKLKVTNDYVIFIFLIRVTLWYSYKYILRINRGMPYGRKWKREREREVVNTAVMKQCLWRKREESLSYTLDLRITIIHTYA